MRYIRSFLFLMVALLVITGCSSKTEVDSDTVMKKVDGFEIQLTSAKELDSEDEKILQLNFSVTNKDSDTRTFDSFVFTAENSGGNKLKIAPKENFGSEIKPGETKEGSVYYYLEGTAPITVTYDDLESDATETWEIKEIEK